jgi:acetyltransferase-like isoleucine patch superfamily enzyme
MNLGRIRASVFVLLSQVLRRFRAWLARPAFAQHGRRFRFDPDGSYTHSTIHVGDDVDLGVGAILWAASPAYIEIRDKVIFGPNVTIMAGDHIIDVPGAFMADLHKKRPGDDLPVIIERDVWIGANATILKGVTLGRGCVVAAGSVVTRSTEPCTMVGGVPARKIRDRFTPEQMVAHELFMGPEKALPGL